MPPTSSLRSCSQLFLDRTAYSSIAPRRLLLDAPQTACFSTSAARHALVIKKKNMAAAPKRGTRTLNVKKGRKTAATDMSKRPAIGERKALRKRVVLSNDNALEVFGLQDLDKKNVFSEEIEGKVMGIPELTVDALRAVEAFKPKQGWSLFRRPAVLMRKETSELAKLMQQVESVEGGEKRTIRRILTGSRMSGKSTLLLQGLMMAHVREWTIINIPEAQDLVNAHTEYGPLPGSNPLQYTQDVYTSNLLSQTLKANPHLSSLPLKTNPNLPLPLPPNPKIKHLIDLGVANPEASWPVFTALWQELTQPGLPPIMLALDGLSHIMRNSEYVSADIQPIHAHDLTLIRHFVNHLSGQATLPNGGMILAATSGSNAPKSEAADFCIQCAEARRYSPEAMPKWNPYRDADRRVMECLRDVDVLKAQGLSKQEARAIMEYYAESGMLRAKVDEPFVAEKWSLAGMGIVGELERTVVKMRV